MVPSNGEFESVIKFLSFIPILPINNSCRILSFSQLNKKSIPSCVILRQFFILNLPKFYKYFCSILVKHSNPSSFIFVCSNYS